MACSTDFLTSCFIGSNVKINNTDSYSLSKYLATDGEF